MQLIYRSKLHHQTCQLSNLCKYKHFGLHKVVVRTSAFLAFPSAWDGVESECTRVESEGLKCQFLQVEIDLDLQEIIILVPISNKKALRKKVIVGKDEEEEGEVGKKIHCV